MIVPLGSPAWLRANSHSEYGGHVDKANWMSQGLVNGRTDVGAEAFVRMCADLEALQRVGAFSVLRILCNDTSPAAPTIQVVNQMNGYRSASYAGGSPPAGFPTGARNGNGDVTITWASSYTDAYGVAGAINVRHAIANLIGSTSRSLPVELVSATAVRVRVFVSTSGAAATDPAFILRAWTGG